MPITGTWKDRQTVQAGATKWGTGWNPVHAIPAGLGRSDTPPNLVFDGTESAGPIDPSVTDPYTPEHLGYSDEDTANVLYGYGVNTGTSERPPLGTDTDRASSDGFPAYGPRVAGVPGGTKIRSQDIGAELTLIQKQTPNEDVAQGWVNKDVGDVENATVSDPSQYEMQTSMTQRDKVREGSQVQSGRASEYMAPIASRRDTWGQRLKAWSGGERHYDMAPRVQDQIIRPWWARNAGVGYPSWMGPNEMYVSEPLQRTSPPDPYQGASSPADDSPAGWTDEDVIPYV